MHESGFEPWTPQLIILKGKLIVANRILDNKIKREMLVTYILTHIFHHTLFNKSKFVLARSTIVSIPTGVVPVRAVMFLCYVKSSPPS